MVTKSEALSQEAITAIERGNLIEAIKIVRATTGLGLSEAKYLVDSYLQENPESDAVVSTKGATLLTPSTETIVAAGLSSAVIMALSERNVVAAVKIVRQEHNLSLKQAKDVVDTYLDANPALRDEMRSGGNPLLTFILLAAGIGLIVYYFMVFK